jgi:putative restriction endonuclease
MVNLYIGITDFHWFQFLSMLPDIEEVNFWQPGGRTNFKALKLGELFLFKLHAPRNFIVGGGVFARADILPISLAWDAFGIANGAASLAEMRARIAHYRKQPDDARQDYLIGCRILTQPFFLPQTQWISVPESFSPQTQQGRRYSTSESDGRWLWNQIMERLPAYSGDDRLSAPRYGEPALIRPRLGQGAFRVGVTGVYHRRCAVTGER